MRVDSGRRVWVEGETSVDCVKWRNALAGEARVVFWESECDVYMEGGDGGGIAKALKGGPKKNG